MPDSWKSADIMEGYRHFYDYDIPHGGTPTIIMENHYGIVLPVYNEKTISLFTDGTQPWALEDNFNMFVACLKASDWSDAAQLAGVIAHYVEDGSMPLHATSDYDADNGGAWGDHHAIYESTVDHQVSIDNVNADVSGYVPHELLPHDNIFETSMQELAESYGFTGYTSDKLSYWLFENVYWNATVESITENRLRTATETLANVWYTGMYEAGLVTPPITRGVNVSISPSDENALHGNALTYAVTVTNMGNVTDNYNLGISDILSWTLALDNNSFDNVQDHGGVVTTTLRVTIPQNAAYGTVDNITVTATSQTDNAVSGSGSCTARSATVSCKLSIYPAYLATLRGENITFTVWVKNTSNDPVFRDNYTFIASDDAGWPLSIGNIENVLTGENKAATLTVTIPENAVINTNDNILVTAISSENSNVRDNGQCAASAAVYSGTANIRLTPVPSPSAPYLYGIYKVTLTENLLVSGDNLHLIFLKYDNKTIEADNVIWSRTAPGAETVTFTNLIFQHDNRTPPSPPSSYIKRVKLVLTDNAGTVVLDNMAWYTVVQDDWSNRISYIILKWGSHNSSQQDQLSNEISTIILNWGSVPTTRDQHDFSQP
jgi:uncharacterized repeat protein (TIGR01451 family)